MPSKRKLASVVSRTGLGGGSAQDHEIPIVEIDTTFARVLGLTEGQKVINSLDASNRPEFC